MINRDYDKNYTFSTEEDTVERDRDRVKKNGEVFTPSSIVEKMMDMVSDESVWSDPAKKFIDPTCGNGNILIGILRRRLANGVSPKDAVSTLYGIELMEDNVILARKRIAEEIGTHEYDDIIEHNIVCSDFFKWDLENWKSTEKKARALF